MKGEALWGFVVLAPGVDARRRVARRARRAWSRPPGQGRSSRRPSASSPRCRRRAAPRCCGAPSGRPRSASDPGDLSSLEDPAAIDAVQKPPHDGVTGTGGHGAPQPTGRAAAARRSPTSAAGARCGGAAATGSRSGSRRHSPGQTRRHERPRRRSRPRCSARQRERQLGTGYGFGIFVDDRFAGEINVSSASGARSRTRMSATGSTRQAPARATCRRRWSCVARFTFEDLHLHRLQISIIPRNVASRRVVEKLATARGGLRRSLPRDQRRVGGPRPLRDHGRGVGRASRGAAQHLGPVSSPPTARRRRSPASIASSGMLEFDSLDEFETRLGQTGLVDVHTEPTDGWPRGIAHDFCARAPASGAAAPVERERSV